MGKPAPGGHDRDFQQKFLMWVLAVGCVIENHDREYSTELFKVVFWCLGMLLKVMTERFNRTFVRRHLEY